VADPGRNRHGKELIAKAIHYISPRKVAQTELASIAAPFPRICLEIMNCSATSNGAFTGAAQNPAIGKFRNQANGGTIFTR
jgi:transcriptional regulator with PAS, ATPase and Fis domain